MAVNTTPNSSTNLITKIKNNWVNILTLLFAFLAILISIDANISAKEAQLPKIAINQVFLPNTKQTFYEGDLATIDIEIVIDNIPNTRIAAGGDGKAVYKPNVIKGWFVYGDGKSKEYGVILYDISNLGGKALSLVDIEGIRKVTTIKLSDGVYIKYKIDYFGTEENYDKWIDEIPSKDAKNIDKSFKSQFLFSAPPLNVESGQTKRLALKFIGEVCFERGVNKLTRIIVFNDISPLIKFRFADNSHKDYYVNVLNRLVVGKSTPYCDDLTT